VIDRRAFLGSLVAVGAAAAAAGCGRPGGSPGVLRVGFMPNLTHGPMMSAIAEGRLARALGATRVESRVFRAGPRVTEALLGRAIDVGVAGPSAVLAMNARHPGSLRVLGGVCSGGASLLALPGVRFAADLRGKRVATPQLGSTQDVSLRLWLQREGVRTHEKGGDVVVDALASSDIFAQMQRGRIAAAWLPEPWASRVALELTSLGATRLFDERDLWPERRFPTALLVVRREFEALRGEEVAAVGAAVREEIAWVRASLRAPSVIFGEIKRLTTKGLPKPVVDESWRRVDFGDDPLRSALATMAHDAASLGYVPSEDTSGLFA
jgi:NitT/TauT family transport system substrate-binding protein